MADKHSIFEQLIPSREALWENMKNELASEGIERLDIWGSIIPADPTGTGFRSGLYLYPVHKHTAGTFIICAGGAFLFKSFNEAKPVAEYFYSRGFNAAILDYTVKGLSNADLQNVKEAAGKYALQAIRYLRANADKYGIPADKIAIGGFSAGGMTSQMAATRYDFGDHEADDPVLRVSSRPDAVLLLYGAFSSTTSIGGLGYDANKQNDAARLDPIRNIRFDCPPVFIFQTNADDPRNALVFAMELAHRGISYEIHTFTEGPHGGGLYNGLEDTPRFDHTAKWADLAADWLRIQGF